MPALAQPPSPQPKPYTPVAIIRPTPFDDATFIAFRRRFAAAAKSRIYADLAPLVVEQGFFWDHDFSLGFDARKPAVDNLAAAVALEHDNGSGWRRLAAFSAESTVEPLETRPGVVCGPARPHYDVIAYSKLLSTSYTSAADWAYPWTDDAAVRSAPQPDAALIGMLGPAFVQVLEMNSPDREADAGRNLWTHVALADGRTGYVATGALRSLTAERLCYIKGLVGWRITGYIAKGD